MAAIFYLQKPTGKAFITWHIGRDFHVLREEIKYIQSATADSQEADLLLSLGLELSAHPKAKQMITLSGNEAKWYALFLLEAHKTYLPSSVS